MEQRIVGFHLDDEQHWVAELECGHNQHVRHDPPWTNRPWTTSVEGRNGVLGRPLACRKCDQEAPPDRPDPALEGSGTAYQMRLLGAGDASLLLSADPQIFDRAVDPRWTDEFLGDPRHHVAVAIFGGLVVGSATATHYVQPDQPPTLLIIEVAVAPEHRRQGLARALLQVLLAHGRALGCTKARVGTEADNAAARSLYASVLGALDSDAFVTYTFDLT